MSAVAAGRQPLTDLQRQAALLDPCVFTDHHCMIEGARGRLERFRLWPEQREVIGAMDESDRLIVLKARQLGISWCADAYALWLCSANQGQTVLIMSLGMREAQEELRRIRLMHRYLPPELKCRLGQEVGGAGHQDNLSTLEFPDLGSRIISLPSTEHAGTSFTANLVVIQELAKIQTATSLMAALAPTIADGGRLFVVSTARGYSGVFYALWQQNQHLLRAGQIVGDKGEPGSFRPVFLPWTVRPGRDQAWYESMSRTLPDRERRQEYPLSPVEAFQGSTDAVFGEEFDRQTHALNAGYERSNVYTVVGSVDPGVNHGVAHLIEVQGPIAWIFHEIHLENRSTPEMGEAIEAAIRHHGLDPAEVIIYPDPYDIGRNKQTLKTEADVLQERGLYIDREDDRYTPAQRVSLIKVLLKSRRLYISTDCPGLLNALERAPWKTRRAPGGEVVREDTYAKDGLHEHFLDSAGTGLARIYPPIAAAAVETSQAVATVLQDSYSGSMYG